MGKFVPDVDIDFADRNKALEGLNFIPASQLERDDLKKHNVGVYFQSMPQDPLTGLSSIPYKEAEERGYYKIDFLPLKIYQKVRDMAHLRALLVQEPIWEILEEKEICENMFQLNGVIDGIPTYELIDAYKPRSIMDLAIFLALIRPRKKHLIGREWDEVKKEIWTPGDPELYGFKKAHSVSYAHVVVIQMNLMVENLNG